MGMTRSNKDFKNGDRLLDYHEKQLPRLSANFALTADLCFTLAGQLKFEELLMGRLEKEAQDALKEASDNFPGMLGGVAGTVMKIGCFPLGNMTRPYNSPPDAL